MDVPTSSISIPTPAPAVSSAPMGDPKKEVGVYTLAPGLDLTISYRDGKLYAQATNQPEFTLQNLGGRKYTIGPPVPPGIFLTFQPSKADPNQTELQFEQGGFKVTVVAKTKTAFVAPISVEELFAKAVVASGGEANLKKYTNLRAEFVLEMPTQGVKGEGVTYRQTPNNEAETVTLRAAGKKIGSSRNYFDGKHGGSESSISGKDVISEDRIPRLRATSDFYPLLNWKTNFKTVTIKGVEKLGDEEVYLVEETLEKGEPIIERYSTKSFLLLQRNSKELEQSLGIAIETVEKFSDYRPVNGVMFPFKRVQTQMNTNETHIEYKKVQFDTHFKPTIFSPARRG